MQPELKLKLTPGGRIATGRRGRPFDVARRGKNPALHRVVVLMSESEVVEIEAFRRQAWSQIPHEFADRSKAIRELIRIALRSLAVRAPEAKG